MFHDSVKSVVRSWGSSAAFVWEDRALSDNDRGDQTLTPCLVYRAVDEYTILATVDARDARWRNTPEKWHVRFNTNPYSWRADPVEATFDSLDEAKRYAETTARLMVAGIVS